MTSASILSEKKTPLGWLEGYYDTIFKYQQFQTNLDQFGQMCTLYFCIFLFQTNFSISFCLFGHLFFASFNFVIIRGQLTRSDLRTKLTKFNESTF